MFRIIILVKKTVTDRMNWGFFAAVSNIIYVLNNILKLVKKIEKLSEVDESVKSMNCTGW